MTLAISPGSAGYNEISFFYFDEDGDWLRVESVDVRLTFLDFSAGAVVAEAVKAHPGHAFLAGDHIRHAGKWRIEAVFKRPGFDDVTAAFRVVIP